MRTHRSEGEEGEFNNEGGKEEWWRIKRNFGRGKGEEEWDKKGPRFPIP